MATRTPLTTSQVRSRSRVWVDNLTTMQNVLYNDLVIQQAQITNMTKTIRDRYVSAYRDTITGMLADGGCSGSGNAPSGADATAIDNMVSRDVDSIANTQDTGAQRLVVNLTTRHPDWSRSQYRAEMLAWQEQRFENKNNQIVFASKTNAAEYARQRFIEMNNLNEGSWVWDADPPIVFNSHQECIRRVRQGAVSWEVAKDWEKTQPNCRHVKRPLATVVLDCATVWRG